MWERFREGRKIASLPRRAGRGRHRKPTPSTWWVFRPLFILLDCRLYSPPTCGRRDGALSLPVGRCVCVCGGGVSGGWGMQVEWVHGEDSVAGNGPGGWKRNEPQDGIWRKGAECGQPRVWWKGPTCSGMGQPQLHPAWTQTAEVTTAFGSNSEGVMCFGGVCHLTVLGAHIYSPIPWEASRAATPSPAFGTMRSTGCCTSQLLFWRLLRFDFKISILMIPRDGLWMIQLRGHVSGTVIILTELPPVLHFLGKPWPLAWAGLLGDQNCISSSGARSWSVFTNRGCVLVTEKSSPHLPHLTTLLSSPCPLICSFSINPYSTSSFLFYPFSPFL